MTWAAGGPEVVTRVTVSRLRNATTSSRKLSPTMVRMNHGSLASTTVAKSANVAVTPPMYTRSVVPRSAAGMVSSRKVLMRSEVAFASGEVPGVT